MMRFIPDLMSFSDGSSVRHIADWQKRRAEILKILSEEEYGVTPPAPETVRGTVGRVNASCCAGHAVLEEITISFDTPNKPFSFPVHFFCPTAERKHPLFIFLNFRPDAYDRYIPVEEVVDNGFAVASVNYADVTSDDGDFTNGLAGRYPRTAPTAWGKIGMWAFAASRMIDYFVTRPEIDADLICVIGHSRLGKTALWCAAQDERVKYVFSNDSGCCGAAYEREKHAGAETIADITRQFPYWFCENFLKYASAPDTRPFDQHFLLSLIAPRSLGVGSAQKDLWADPYAEQLSCIAASPVWSLYGTEGYTGKQTPFEAGESADAGRIHYHLRDGIHYLSRNDWIAYMRFVRGHN